MDMGQLKTDMKKAIGLMTPAMQVDAGNIFHIIVKHMPQIEKIGPDIGPLLMPHIQTAAVEFAMGMMNDKATRDALDQAMREAFGEMGIVVPSAPSKG